MPKIARVQFYPCESIFPVLQRLNTAGEQKETFVIRMTMERDRDAWRDGTLQYAITSSSLRWQNKEFDCRSEYVENNARLFIASMRNLNGH
jgi:hypothetical protein